MRRTIVLSTFCTLGLASGFAECQPLSEPWVSRAVEVGRLVGVQYIPGQDRYFLYATCRAPLSTLYRDYVVEMARAATEAGDFGFSLDFERTGDSRFREDDVLSGSGLAARLLTSDGRFARALRTRYGRDDDLRALQRAGEGPRPGGPIRRLTAFLNRATEMDEMWGLVPASEMSPYTASVLKQYGHDEQTRARLGRLLLEDFFGAALRHGIARHYVIAYKPTVKNNLVRRILGHTRSENALLSADTWLKRLSSGEGVPPDLVYGPSELALCAAEAQDLARAGKTPSAGEYVNFFSLHLEYEPAALAGIAVWFREPRLVVQSATADENPLPPCADRFARSLSRHMDNLLNQSGRLGGDMRVLEMLMLLNRAMTILASVAPLTPQRVSVVPTERLLNEPPEIVRVPIYFAAGGKATGFSVSGGVQMTGGGFRAFPPRAQISAPSRDTFEDQPGEAAFHVSPVTIDGLDLLRIEISAMLGGDSGPNE